MEAGAWPVPGPVAVGVAGLDVVVHEQVVLDVLAGVDGVQSVAVPGLVEAEVDQVVVVVAGQHEVADWSVVGDLAVVHVTVVAVVDE